MLHRIQVPFEDRIRIWFLLDDWIWINTTGIRHNLNILSRDGQDTRIFGITMPSPGYQNIFFLFDYLNILCRSTKYAIHLILRNFRRKLFPSIPLIGIFGNGEIGFDSATMPSDQERILHVLIFCCLISVDDSLLKTEEKLEDLLKLFQNLV